ncbi:hypothetical protein C943_03285 [Mariniradius saccharolyticus AK6]|uniref:Uncharacterized protein n=1 Tax=Mariniradius saccharolyticus AK6 TaxID=1239962 RepID=M7XJ62_9BACT|nr:hypothetical protein [Mariniradius saccharolyticus]EMS34598.1 hypothetical protein C943_03285 [Mariniradius saccharolyticus AK6]
MKLLLNVTNPLYRDYFRYLFEEQSDGIFRISRESDVGKFICSFVRYSDRPVQQPKTEETLVLLLPNTDVLKDALYNHVYLSKTDQAQINDFLHVFFNIDLDRYYLKGIKQRMRQKDIIESFIVSRKLTNLLQDNETLKKRLYREELAVLQERFESLRKRTWYRNQKIEFDPEKYLVK